MNAEVEAPLRRLEDGFASVRAVVVVNEHGFPMHATGLSSVEAANAVATSMNELAHLGRNLVRNVDPTDELLFLRVRCGKSEYVVGAKDDHLVVVHQNLRKVHSDIMARASAGDGDEDDVAAGSGDPAGDMHHIPDETLSVASGVGGGFDPLAGIPML